jgi:hypothetical protein
MAFRAKPAEERLPESPEHLFRELGGAAGGHYRAGTGGEHVRIGLPTGKRFARMIATGSSAPTTT